MLKILKSRERSCLFCKKLFIPRKYQIDTGYAKYCSALCRNKAGINKLCTKESRQKALETYIKKMKNGEIEHKKGEDHPRWNGGQKESIKRRIQSGKASELLKKYRKQNPDKVREWKQSRSRRKYGRLPRGTIKAKQESQGYKCAYCKTDTSVKFHVDHIIPLAKGGKHEPDNVQITCPSCNVRKCTKLDFKP